MATNSYGDNVDIVLAAAMQIGIIGMGVMGKMYAKRLAAAGWQ